MVGTQNNVTDPKMFANNLFGTQNNNPMNILVQNWGQGNLAATHNPMQMGDNQMGDNQIGDNQNPLNEMEEGAIKLQNMEAK